MTVAVEDMRAMSDEELLGLYAAGEEAALTVAAERDQATANAARIAPAHRAQEAIREEWHNQALADYAAARASMTCKGTMFSPEGFANGPADEFSLWTVRDSDARRWASRELREWWDLHGRLTVGKYAKQRADAIRAAREDTATREAGSDEGFDRRAGLAEMRRAEFDMSAALGAVRERRRQGASRVRPARRQRASRICSASRTTANRRGSYEHGPDRGRRGRESPASVAPRREVTGQVVRRPASQAARPPAKPIDGAMLADLTDDGSGITAT